MKNVLITGAASGLGRALAIEAHRRGAFLYLVDVSPDVRQVAAQLAGKSLVIDLADPDAPQRVHDWAPEIDLLINNAGIAVRGPFHELSGASLDRLLGVNIRTPLMLSRLYLERFRTSGGTIVNVSSSAGYFPTPGLGPYGASKAFLTAMSETLEAEIASANRARVLCICPAGMATNFQSSHGVQNENSRVLMDPATVARWCLDDVARGAIGVRNYGVTAHGMGLLRRILPRRMFVRLTGRLVARYR